MCLICLYTDIILYVCTAAQVAKAQQLLGLEAEENRQMAEQGQYRSTEVFKAPREVTGSRAQPAGPTGLYRNTQSSVFADIFQIFINNVTRP